MTRTLQAVHCYGIDTDSLGHYLCGMGLLSAVSREWPEVAACWRGGHFLLLRENISLQEVVGYLLNRWQPTPYERWWTTSQKTDTKAKSSVHIWSERNRRSNVEVRILDAHIVGARRNRFNPMLGTGGNIGKRDLAKLWKDARKLLSDTQSQRWLEATLTGEATVPLPDLSSAGTWFVFANKTFNSGQEWFREGRLSPWSVLLAMEGALLLVGGISRRLGARSRPYAVFPFICDPTQPVSDNEIGLAKAEFWAPLWGNPANLTEVRGLFQRGLARLGGRAAQAPHEFAIAACAAGMDAGISEFARYEFRQTTSAKVYEAIPHGHIAVGRASTPERGQRKPVTEAELLIQLVESGWMERLPYEPRDPKQRGKFRGLRGPVEAAILQIGEHPDDPVPWRELLLHLARVQMRIDRNKNLRDRCLPLPPLQPGWFSRAWPGSPPPEIRVARAIASIGAGADQPLLVNVYGVEFSRREGRAHFPSARPQRAVWHNGNPVRVLTEIFYRRLVDAGTTKAVPLDGTCPCCAKLLEAFLRGDVCIDAAEVLRWLPPLALIDWSNCAQSDAADPTSISASDGSALLHDLFRPLFHPRPLQFWGGLLQLFEPHVGTARRLLNLIQHGSLDEAVQVARDRYLACGRMIVMPPSGLRADVQRLAAALLIPMRDADVQRSVNRWFQPSRNT